MTCLDVLAAICPDCVPGREARALVLSQAFWTNAWYAVLPFAVIALVARWFVGRLDRGGDDGGGDDGRSDS